MTINIIIRFLACFCHVLSPTSKKPCNIVSGVTCALHICVCIVSILRWQQDSPFLTCFGHANADIIGEHSFTITVNICTVGSRSTPVTRGLPDQQCRARRHKSRLNINRTRASRPALAAQIKFVEKFDRKSSMRESQAADRRLLPEIHVRAVAAPGILPV